MVWCLGIKIWTVVINIVTGITSLEVVIITMRVTEIVLGESVE